MRRRIGVFTALLTFGTLATLPGTVASGDSAGGMLAPGEETPTPAPAVPMPPPAPPALAAAPGHPALEPPAGPVVGQMLTLNGAVDRGDAGRPVAVQQRSGQGNWADIGTTASHPDGSFSVRWRPRAAGPVALRAALADADAPALQRLFVNDLQAAARAVEPRLARLLDDTQLNLSGSGSTLFGYGRRTPAGSTREATSICWAHSRDGNR